MNSINFEKDNFPLTTSVLGFLQDLVKSLERITSIIGGNYILSGCEIVGSSINTGWVVVNGELMEFTGGTFGSGYYFVRVDSVSQNVFVNDAYYTITTKKLVTGTGSSAIAWSTFRRATDILSMIEKRAFIGDHPTDEETVVDYLSGFPAGTTPINFGTLIPGTAKFALVAIEYRWGYSSSQDIYISSVYSNKIRLQATNNWKYEQLVVPVSGNFKVDDIGEYHNALQIKFTLIGYW